MDRLVIETFSMEGDFPAPSCPFGQGKWPAKSRSTHDGSQERVARLKTVRGIGRVTMDMAIPVALPDATHGVYYLVGFFMIFSGNLPTLGER
jgi:hypothetical protein